MKLRFKLLLVAALGLGASVLATSGNAQVLIYDNTTTFSGSAFSNTGATAGNGKKTLMVADDLTYNPLFAAAPVTAFKFSLSNLNTAALALSPTVLFYDSDGTNGGPGTLLASFAFNPITINASSVSVVSFTITDPLQYFLLPTDGTIWAGIFYTGSSTETAAQTNKFGQALFGPPTVGSSQDRLFRSTAVGPTGSNPAGTIFASPFSGAPVASFGWQLSTSVPEPASVALLAVGGLGLLVGAQRRRRNRR